MSNNSLEKIFQIVAAVLLGVAAFFLWQESFDGVFVAVVLGAVSFLLSYRFKLKERLERELAEENYRGSLYEPDFTENELAELDLENDREEIPIER